MSDLRLRFPGGKSRALTFSYDDGLPSDIRLISILNKYGMKGTFNINGGGFRSEDTPSSDELKIDRSNMWTRAKKSELLPLFEDGVHEVANHGYGHVPLGRLSLSSAISNIVIDRYLNENDFSRLVRGAAYPNGSYNDTAAEALKLAGIAYCRTTSATRRFDLPTNWLKLDPTCHHNDPRLFELAKEFVEAETREPLLFYLWGHSSEFVVDGNWDRIESFCELLSSARDAIWFATNIEIYDYVKAFESLVRSADGRRITNPTATDIYASNWGKHDIVIPAGKTVKL